MVTCELDSEISGELLGLKLPTWQALLMHRALPSCGGLIVYLTVICFDTALIYEHYNHGHNGVGAFCIILMVLPALISLVFTLASPPPGLQTSTSACAVTIQKKEAKWIVLQIINCIFFPVAVIGRYMHQIFWWIEVIFAIRAKDHQRTKEALQCARAPSPLELYLFLQAFMHSAPHSIVNILDLMARFRDPAFGKVSVQAVSIIASIMRMASTATLYRRFEREKLCGRKYPWQIQEDTDDDNKNEETPKESDAEPIYEPILKKPSISSEKSTNSRKNANSDLIRFSSEVGSDKTNANSDLIKFSPAEEEKSHPWDDAYYSDSGTSSDYIPQEVFKTSHESSLNSDEEYLRPISIIDKVAPRRQDKQYPIERVEIIPPPMIPAPRPMSLALWAERIVENAENIPVWLSAPPRRRHGDVYVIPEEPEIPYRVPRSYMRGLEPQDLSGMLVQYFAWYAFFISRLVSIAAFINSVPVVATIILMSHYQIMLLFLIVPQASTVRRAFYVFLAFIYLFCLMEFKIRFRHVRVWHVFWIIVCTIETIIFTAVWTYVGNNFGDWWRLYVIKIVLYNIILSYMCFLVYFVVLNPREVVVYTKKTRNSISTEKVKSSTETTPEATTIE